MSLQRARGLGVWALQWQILQFTNTFEVERWHIMWAFHLNWHLLGTKDMQILRTSTLDRGINTEKKYCIFLPWFSQNQMQSTLRIRILQSLLFQLALCWSILTQLCFQLLHSSMWYVYQPQFNCICLPLYRYLPKWRLQKHTLKPFAGCGASKIDKWAVELKYFPSEWAILSYESFGWTRTSKFISKVLLLHAISLKCKSPAVVWKWDHL